MSSIELSARSFLRVYLESISWTILALAGFLGNILVFAALARNPILRRYTPIYVNALAISDILNFLYQRCVCGSDSGQWSLAVWAGGLLRLRLFCSFHDTRHCRYHVFHGHQQICSGHKARAVQKNLHPKKVPYGNDQRLGLLCIDAATNCIRGWVRL